MRRTIDGHLESSNVQRQAGFYYDNRLRMMRSAARLGSGIVDYDYHRVRAHAARKLALRQMLKPRLSMIRPALAIAILLATIWLLPTRAEPCRNCTSAAPHTLIR